jgi:type I restriction enzyme M protein
MTLTADIEKRLWNAADQLWTNSALRPDEYSTPVLALIFLKYADHKFAEAEKTLQAGGTRQRKRSPSKSDYLAEGVLYVPEDARFQLLLELPEGADIGKKVNAAMKAIEAENPELKDVLPKTYGRFETATLASLLKAFGTIPMDADGDVFGRIYEYFLGNFAPRTLQKGGEFFTPVSIVKLIAEVVQPFHGRLLDPACGSGGMFVQSARFLHERKKNPSEEISVFGIEKISQTLRLTKMNLAVHGLPCDIREANTYYEDPHDCVGRFDFVMANPPFNQNAVDKDRIKDDTRRFPFGIPNTDNANYLWIQLFYSALNAKGRAGFVMANSASDARGSEADIRRQLIQTGAVDVIITLSSNFFYTVTLPATLWFFDRGKEKTKRKNQILFIDARNIFRQVDRAHRDFTPEQIEYLANIVRLYRGEKPENLHGGEKLLKEHFPKKKYEDVPGLCKLATLDEVEGHDWSLNPGRYVGVAAAGEDNEDFLSRLEALQEELINLDAGAAELGERVNASIAAILKGGA